VHPRYPGTDGREARMEYTGNPGLPPRSALARGLARVLGWPAPTWARFFASLWGDRSAP